MVDGSRREPTTYLPSMMCSCGLSTCRTTRGSLRASVRHTDAFSGVVQRDATIYRLERNDPSGGNDRVLRAAPDGGPGQSPSERAVERRLEGPVAEGAAEEATPTAAEADA